jgi:hypothetical protein
MPPQNVPLRQQQHGRWRHNDAPPKRSPHRRLASTAIEAHTTHPIEASQEDASFTLVLLFDLVALSGPSQIFILKPIKTAEVRFTESFASDNQTLPDPLDFGARKQFGLWGWQESRAGSSLVRQDWALGISFDHSAA